MAPEGNPEGVELLLGSFLDHVVESLAGKLHWGDVGGVWNFSGNWLSDPFPLVADIFRLLPHLSL